MFNALRVSVRSLVALILVWFVALGAACSTLSEVKDPAAEAVKLAGLAECYAQALVPVMGTAKNAREAVKAVTERTVTLQELFDAAQATEREIRDFQEAIELCNAKHAPGMPPVSTPEPEPGHELGASDAGPRR